MVTLEGMHLQWWTHSKTKLKTAMKSCTQHTHTHQVTTQINFYSGAMEPRVVQSHFSLCVLSH